MARGNKDRRRSVRRQKALRGRRQEKGKWCTYCKRILEPAGSKSGCAFTLDHVMPRKLGGRRTTPCCLDCNRMKADMHPDDWRRFTQTYPEWWKRFDTTKPVMKQIERIAYG